MNYFKRNSLDNWHYALPKDILRQIQYFEPNSNETKELFYTLKEQIDLINTPKIKWDEYNNYTETEIRKSHSTKHHLNTVIRNQLINVRDSLMKMERYSELNVILPEIVKK